MCQVARLRIVLVFTDMRLGRSKRYGGIVEDERRERKSKASDVFFPLYMC